MPGPGEIAETYVTADTLDDELAGWMHQLAAYRWRQTEPLDPAAAALLVVDMNRPFVDSHQPPATPNARAVVPRIAALAEAFRSADRPVLWIIQGHHSVEHDRGGRLSAWWPTPLLEGTRDVEPADGLEIAPGEKVIVKRRYSGFYQTDLEVTLRCLGISQLVICGILTHVCPFATAMDAFIRDFCVFYPADATASVNRDLHVGALCTVAGWCGHVVTSGELIVQLSARRR